MWLSTAVKYVSLTWQTTKANIMSAMEYRASFLMQVVGMVVNDIALIAIWFIFFQKFPVLNGWSFNDSIVLYSFTTISFAWLMIIGGGIVELARIISQGELDYFLTLPKSVLWQVTVSRSMISAIGDLVFGLTLIFFWQDVTLIKLLVMLFMGGLSALIFYNFIVVTQSMSFFFGNFEGAAEQFFHGLLGFSLYPQSAFAGVLKIIMMTIIPAFFIFTLPLRLINEFNWKFFGLIILFWLISSLIAYLVFKSGLKRYESGNLINVKM